MRSDIPQPCCGSSASVRKMRRSKVPCGRSIRSLAIPYPFASTDQEITIPVVEVQGVGPLALDHSFAGCLDMGYAENENRVGCLISGEHNRTSSEFAVTSSPRSRAVSKLGDFRQRQRQPNVPSLANERP